MSTKELYTAFLTSRMDSKPQMIFQMDEAIRKFMGVERELQSLIGLNGSADLLRHRVKLILCEDAAKQYKPIEIEKIEGSDLEQLQMLAKAMGCPLLLRLCE